MPKSKKRGMDIYIRLSKLLSVHDLLYTAKVAKGNVYGTKYRVYP